MRVADDRFILDLRRFGAEAASHRTSLGEVTMQTAVYRAPVYEPTVDELETLKKLELGEDVSLWSAAKEYLSRRLLEWGLVEQDAEKHWHITESGRMVIRRQL